MAAKERKCHVIFFATPKDVLSVYLEPGGVTHHRYGDFYHDDAFDLPFGSKLRSRKDDSKFVYLLKPTPELWSRTLPHRTQIVWSRDAATITYKLNLKRGDVVVESGTGSGSLTHHFVRGVAPSGHVHTFDFNETRCERARKEFQLHGISKFVTVRQADACAPGAFNIGDNVKADVVFLDLPSPWNAIDNVSAVLRPGGRVCTFSPCVEQVTKTCKQLRDQGYTNIETWECLNRDWIIVGEHRRDNGTLTRPDNIMRGHTSYLTFAVKKYTEDGGDDGEAKEDTTTATTITTTTTTTTTTAMEQ